MLDRHKIIKEIADLGPEWARGCEACEFGLVVAPEIAPMLNTSEGRAIQMDEDMIEFCNCRAGHMYRQHLRRVLTGINLASRKNMREFVISARVPSIHLEPTL